MDAEKIKYGSGTDVPDFSGFCEGDVELSTNKKIKRIISSAVQYIVFLDEQYNIEWATNKDYKWPENSGKILNDICLLELRSHNLLNEKQRPDFQRLLAECAARLIDSTDNTLPEKAVQEARNELLLRSTERAKKWYVFASGVMSIFFLVICLVLWNSHNFFKPFLGNDFIDIIIYSMAGAIGSFISVTGRLEKINVNAAAGMMMHIIDSCLRVSVGVVGAFFVILALKSRLLFGTFNISPENINYFYVVVAILCGASERFVPSIINTVESTLTKKSGGEEQDTQPDASQTVVAVETTIPAEKNISEPGSPDGNGHLNVQSDNKEP